MVGAVGAHLGLAKLSDKCEGDFNANDEATLVQLAAVAAPCIGNALLYDHLRQDDRRKDELLAMQAHELRNPVAPLRTGLSLQKRSNEPERVARTREVMDRQLGHMVRLVDDVMDLWRISTGKIRLKLARLDLRSAVEAAVEGARPLIVARHKRFDLLLPGDPVSVLGDATRLAHGAA